MSSHAELYFEHLKGQAQFAYFQLGVAASAIAFAIHETDGRSLSDTPWPIGAAVLLWALSFALGCFGVGARQRGMLTNLQYLEAMRDVGPHAAGDRELSNLMADARRKTETSLNRPAARFRGQLWTLFLGALAYIAGHVMQMATTPSAAANTANHRAADAASHRARHPLAAGDER